MASIQACACVCPSDIQNDQARWLLMLIIQTSVCRTECSMHVVGNPLLACAHRHTDLQTHRQTDRQTERKTDRQTHTHTHTHTHAHTHTHTRWRLFVNALSVCCWALRLEQFVCCVGFCLEQFVCCVGFCKTLLSLCGVCLSMCGIDPGTHGRHDLSMSRLAITTHEGSANLRRRSMGGRQSLYRIASSHRYAADGLTKTTSQGDGINHCASVGTLLRTSSSTMLAVSGVTRPIQLHQITHFALFQGFLLLS